MSSGLLTMDAQLIICMLAFVGVSAAEELTATTIAEEPYVRIKHGVSHPSKPEDYEGYIPELLEKISQKMNKNFTLKLVGDNKYGAETGNKWNGMIGEVVDDKASFAAAPITVSVERSRVVDFTDHFMTFDTIVLLKKDPTTVKIRSVDDLIKAGINCGVVKDGFTENFFKTTDQDIYKNLYKSMKQADFPTTSADGVKKVREGNGKYAFVIESSTADYWMNRECDLISFRLGSALPYHNYSFAVKKNNHDLMNKLNNALRELKSNGVHDVLRAKWWFNTSQCSAASQRPDYVIAAILSGLMVTFVASTKRLF